MTVAVWAQTSSAIVGRWQAEKHGTPWLIVNITGDNNSKLGGRAVFYVLDSSDTANPKVVGKQEVQLLDAKLDGNVFRFQVKNQQAEVTMNPSSGELLTFRMILNDATHAMLKSGDGRDLGLVKRE
jgi:nitrogenase molybdenum-iron protein alpha/beta subunit